MEAPPGPVPAFLGQFRGGGVPALGSKLQVSFHLEPLIHSMDIYSVTAHCWLGLRPLRWPGHTPCSERAVSLGRKTLRPTTIYARYGDNDGGAVKRPGVFLAFVRCPV